MKFRISPPAAVVNIRKTDGYDVYIGRGGNGDKHMNNTEPLNRGWLGNPYVVGEDGDREEVIEKFREDFRYKLQTDETFRKYVKHLAGKVLGCYCHPKPCHGDVIVEAVDDLNPTEIIEDQDSGG